LFEIRSFMFDAQLTTPRCRSTNWLTGLNLIIPFNTSEYIRLTDLWTTVYTEKVSDEILVCAICVASNVGRDVLYHNMQDCKGIWEQGMLIERKEFYFPLNCRWVLHQYLINFKPMRHNSIHIHLILYHPTCFGWKFAIFGHVRAYEKLCIRPPLWSSGQSFWLQIQRFRVRFLALPDYLRSRGSGMGSTQPREDNWGATWMKR
jgi:hypothetical protein